ncbi:response regulator [Thermogemmatispora sp.]|uniref:response regulator n=1 Tax=Thermogemmatispora sp. TaxID=1968838 RepID=UPI001DF44314|nr:response regulator [Thermogemmatispora sp.]MBX5451262.1 response regulator [Thermogemmatispora sp.]
MAQVGLLEDNPRIAKLCATFLDFAGHRVVHYRHPRECLEALRVEKPAAEKAAVSEVDGQASEALPIDILILDLYMPDMPGEDVLRQLRAHPRTRNLPLILCTAAPASEIEQAKSIAPRAIVVEKPFKLQTLTAAIDALMRS